MLAFYRLAFAAVTLGLVAAALRRLALLRLARHAQAALIGVTLAAHWFLYFVTIKLSSVAVAVLMAYLAPIAIALLAPFVLPERRSRSRSPRSCRPQRASRSSRSGEEGGAVRPLASRAAHRRDVRGARADDEADRLRRARADALVLELRDRGGRSRRCCSTWNGFCRPRTSCPRCSRSASSSPRSGYLYIWLRHVTAQAIGILAYIEPVSAALMAWAFLGESLNGQIVVGGRS